jgi:uncharacterized protein
MDGFFGEPIGLNYADLPPCGDRSGDAQVAPASGTEMRFLFEVGTVRSTGAAGAQITLDGVALCRVHNQKEDSCLVRAGRIGSQVKIISGGTWVIATIRAVHSEDPIAGGLLADIEFLGEGGADPDGSVAAPFHRGVTNYPLPGAIVFAVTSLDAAQIYGCRDAQAIAIGTVYPSQDVQAAVHANAFIGRHFALLGSTGTGKSTATALILHKICDLAPQGHVLLIDPHGEYRAAFRDRGEVFDVDNLQLPYWLLNFDEHCELLLGSDATFRSADRDILARCLIVARQKAASGRATARIGADTPVPYLLSDLYHALQSEMGALDKAHESAPYVRIRRQLDALRSDPRFAFMFSGVLVADTMAEVLARLFRLPARGKPISVIDLSGVPAEVVTVVVSLLARLAFEQAMWARRNDREPILFVCEEAHRYVPASLEGGTASAGRMLGRIAKEGRKYGVSLGLITQRPSDLAPDILSQCGTLLSMRLSNDRDQSFVRAAMPEGGKSLLDAIPALRNRECIICGEGVRIPMRLMFEELADHHRPASDDPAIFQAWSSLEDRTALIHRTIQRWRGQ